MGKESVSSFVFDDLAKKFKKPPSFHERKNEPISYRGTSELDAQWTTLKEFDAQVVKLSPRAKGFLFLRPLPQEGSPHYNNVLSRLLREFKKQYLHIHNASSDSRAISPVNIQHTQRILRKIIELLEKKDALKDERKKEKP